jgi:hypothetical protein
MLGGKFLRKEWKWVVSHPQRSAASGRKKLMGREGLKESEIRIG